MKINKKVFTNLSHAFRSPLSSIQFGLDLYLKQNLDVLRDDQREILDDVQQVTERLKRVTDAFLDFRKRYSITNRRRPIAKRTMKT